MNITYSEYNVKNFFIYIEKNRSFVGAAAT